MNLFDKTKIGNIEVRNHFIRSATFEGKANDDGSPTEDIIELYEKLADAKIGVIITSYAYITDYEQPVKKQLGIYSDSLIPTYQALTKRVHEHQGKIVMQIVHGSSSSQADKEHAKILGPSAIPHPTSLIVPKEMDKEDIENVINQFANAARRVKEAGFDGVQIHVAHGYLLAQFISPLFNKRTDDYGGSWENRARLLVEIYQAVREKVGKDYPVWMKINSSDEEENGLTIDEFIQIAKKLADLGMDAIEISGNQWRKHNPEESLYYFDAAKALTEIINIPVILTGGVKTKADLDYTITNSNIQFFGLSRPLMTNINYLEELK